MHQQIVNDCGVIQKCIVYTLKLAQALWHFKEIINSVVKELEILLGPHFL